MTLSNDDAAAGVRRYLDTLATGTSADVAALYAEDAVLEDPVGSEPRVGREAILAFYATLDAMTTTTELHDLRASGGEAAFSFTVRSDTGAGVAVVSPFEAMTFDDAGLITRMRAWWSEADLRME